MSSFRIPVAQGNLRRFDDPHGIEGRFSFMALVKASDVPLGLPMKVNPREQNLRSSVANHIKDGLLNESPDFYLLNQGITVLAETAYFDSKRNELVLDFPSEPSDPEEEIATEELVPESKEDVVPEYTMESYLGRKQFGVVNGGHTYRIITESVQATQENLGVTIGPRDAYVRMEVLAGIDSDLAVKLARARNTANPVKEQSMQELGRNFKWLKDVIEAEPFAKKIAYKENEALRFGLPIEVRQVIQLLMAVHPDYLRRDKHPTLAYTSAGVALKRHGDEERGYDECEKNRKPVIEKGFRQLRPIVIDILKLYDYIRDRSSRIYNDGGGRAGRLKEFEKFKQIPTLHFLDKPAARDMLLHFGCAMPLLSAFRAVIRINPTTDMAEWISGYDPFEVFEREGREMLNLVIQASEELGRNPQSVGKSPRLWSGLYSFLRLSLTEPDVQKE